jgi:ABC-type glutathione transport system ATPase component
LLADVEDVCDRVVIYYGGRIHAQGPLRDLLAKPDSVRITMPAIPRDHMQTILNLIRKDVEADKVQIDNPTQNLESYFLDVVARARAANETSGAQSGARVAEYLRAGAQEPSASEKVLEKLSLPQPAQAAPAANVSSAVAVPKVDDKKLEALAQATPPPSAKPESKPEEKPVDLSQADEKLSSLLGNKK